MKALLIIISLTLVYSCSNFLIKEKVNSTSSPLIAVIKFNSYLDNCLKDSSIIEIADLVSFFKLRDNSLAIFLWYEYVDDYCSISELPMTSRIKKYYDFEIKIEIKKQEAKVFFYHKLSIIEVYSFS